MSEPVNRPFRLAMVVNPFAGIGGALALKGSDGADIRAKALAMGAEKKAGQKMARALEGLKATKRPFVIYTAAGEMGEAICQQAGIACEVVYTPAQQQTEGEDTERAAAAMLEHQPDLLLFAGGDGTARNIYNIAGSAVPVLGVPAGCKIHSGVYSVTPSAAAEVLARVVNGELVSELDAEVKDIDEDAFRKGKVLARHFGEMRVAGELTYIQAVKSGGRESEALVLEDIAAHVAEIMDEEPDTCFVMGSGSTVKSVMDALSLPDTLLGVDVVREGVVIGSDVTADELLSITENQKVCVVITVIGGQGHILGRGNQQLSPTFLRRTGRENLLIVATKQKLQELDGRPLRLDSGDEALDTEWAGMFPIITGYKDKVLYPAI